MQIYKAPAQEFRPAFGGSKQCFAKALPSLTRGREYDGLTPILYSIADTAEYGVARVLCDRPQDAMDEIEGIGGVKEAALFGKGLHVVVESGERAIPLITAVLAEQGYRVERIERIVPSLEDVFVSLIEARDRAQVPQVEVRR